MTQFLDTQVDKSLSSTGSWLDIDLSSELPAGATGAIFQIVNTSSSTSYQFGFRKNGSSDDIYGDIRKNSTWFYVVGVDANRKCEGKIGNTYVDFILVGYTEADATLFTNSYDKSQSTTGVWTDLDLSSELPAGAVAAIFDIESTDWDPFYWGLRKKGSTDNRSGDLIGLHHTSFIVGVDSNRKCQFKIENAKIDFHLIGYLSRGTAETNGVDRSLGSTGSYIDITESDAPAGSTGVYVDFVTTNEDYNYAARKNGVTSDNYRGACSKHQSIFAGLDANKKWEGKIENTGVDFYTLGYFVSGAKQKGYGYIFG